MKFHAACLTLPPMAAHEYDALRKSIAEGWDNRYPILTCDGEILDGRHRFEVCRDLGIEPTFVEWDRRRCDGNPFRFVWQEHDARRNWQSAEQRQLCYDDCEAGAAAWDREHQRIQAEANEARSEAARQQPRTEDGRRLAAKSDSGTTCSTTSLDRHKGLDILSGLKAGDSSSANHAKHD